MQPTHSEMYDHGAQEESIKIALKIILKYPINYFSSKLTITVRKLGKKRLQTHMIILTLVRIWTDSVFTGAAYKTTKNKYNPHVPHFHSVQNFDFKGQNFLIQLI